MKNYTLRAFLLLAAILLLPKCAQIGSPVGGPKDTIPPVLLRSRPAQKAVNVKAKRLELYFDEHVQIKTNSPVTISPPFIKQQPVFSVGKKSLYIDLQEDLIPNRTYVFNFGEGLGDLNEANAMKNFEYVFSTGGHIDSLSLVGRVLDAFTLKAGGKDAKADRFVMLYNTHGDSVPYKNIPDLIARVDEFGIFRINHIPVDTFLLFYLEDVNNNMRFDPPMEKIAFCDTLIAMSPRFLRTDTFPANPKVIDSLLKKNPDYFRFDITLKSFLETPKAQFLKTKERIDSTKIRFIFNKPISGLPVITPADSTISDEFMPFVTEVYSMRDTIDYWITDEVLASRDRFGLIVKYESTDSLFNPITSIDSIAFRNPNAKGGRSTASRPDSVSRFPSVKDSLKYMRRIEKIAAKRAKIAAKDSIKLAKSKNKSEKITSKSRRQVPDNTSKKPDRFPVKLNATQISPFNKIYLESTFPIDTVYFSKLRLVSMKDSTEISVPFNIERDSVSPRKIHIKPSSAFEDGKSYILYADSAAFKGYWKGMQNDTTVNFRFNILKQEENASISISAGPVCGQSIIQLISVSGERISSSIIIRSDSVKKMPYLSPGRYFLRAIHDTNENGVWDTGDWMEKRLPETVEFYSDTIDLKKGFEREVRWKFKETPCLNPEVKIENNDAEDIQSELVTFIIPEEKYLMPYDKRRIAEKYTV